MDVVSPWWRIIWVFVAIGECLGVVPSGDHRYLPGAIPERYIGGPIAVVMPEAAEKPVVAAEAATVTLSTTETGFVTLEASAGHDGAQLLLIRQRVFADCANAPCHACPDGTTAVPDLPRIHDALTKIKAHPEFTEVRSIVISAHEDVIYQRVVHLMDVSNAMRKVGENPTPCDVLAAEPGTELFPNVVFSAME